MSKQLGRIICICVCLCLVYLLAQTTPVLAEETEEVHVIDSKEDFFAIMDDPAGHYRLEADLDLGTITPLGIEPWAEYEQHFHGVLMGNGHTIRYRLEEIPGVEHYGLFGSLNGAEIMNLTICAEINITKNDAGYCYVGMLAGRSYRDTAISGVDVSGSIYVQNSNPDTSDAYQTYVGGLIGFSAGTVLTSCSADIQAEVNCTGGVWGCYGGLVSIGHVEHLQSYGDRAYSCVLSGNAELKGKIDTVQLLVGASNSISTQRVVMDVTDTPTINCDYAGSNNELSGDLDIKLNIAQPSDQYRSPVLTVLENCEGSRFDAMASVSGLSSQSVHFEMAKNCEAAELNGDVICKIKSRVWFDGLKECRNSVFDMDIEIECEDSSYINQMSDGANNQGTSNLSVKNYIGQNQDDYTTFTCCTMTGETQSYLTGNVNIRGEDDSSYVALGSCKGCIFEGRVVCEGNDSFVVGAERGSDNMVLADLTAKGTEYPSTGTVRGISMEENSILIGKCVASGGCGVLDSSTGCAASVSVETKYCTIISWECQNCAVVGSAVADSIDPFASNAVNGYVGMDLIIRNTNFFIVGGENCLFEGSVDLFTEYQWARVESDVPVIVHLPDGKEWNTANGSLYRHDDYYGFPCAEGHALYDVFPYDHYGICVEVAGANSSELPEITDQWPEHMQPDSGEEEPEDGVIQLSLYETADCDESTRIRSMVYSCGNFSWDRTVGTDETDQTNYGTCYLKIQRKGMHEDMILERTELTAPDGFSFSSREMVKTKTINLAAILSGEHVITLYPIYTETEPTAKSVEFLVNGQTFSTGTELKVNPDAGKLYMRSSFDTSGKSSWDDTMKPDFGALRNPSMLYDRGLAQISAAFSGAVYKYEDIYKTLLNFGFSNIQRYNYNPDNDQVVTDMGRHMVAATFATKKVLVEGKVKTLAAVVVRGTVSEEWFGNFDIGTGDRHRGFEMARGYLAPSLFQYLNDHTDTPAETKILITGHSRGAAVANLIAADLNNKYRSVFAEQEDIYTYTFATPNSTSSANDHCSNVFNIINPKDVVTEIPSGFHKVGTDYRIAWPGSQPYFMQVIEKYRALTKGSEEFKEWGLEYAALAKGMRVISHASDLPWGATKVTLEAVGTIAGTVIKWRVVDKPLLEYVKTTFNKDLDFVPLKASILIDYMLKSMEWYRGNDIYDLRTTGDLAAAMLLYADAPEPEGVADKLWAWVQQYAMDRIWCNHAMEFYYSWMVTAPATAVDGVEPVEHPYCVATIRCPVDVNVYNEAGELVASIVNDQVAVGADENCNVFSDEKYFVLEGTNYRFEITGYDAGLVDISVTEYSEMFEKLSVSVFSDLTVQKGETMSLHYSVTAENAAERCYVSTASGIAVYPETKAVEELERNPIQLEVNGTGFVAGDGVYEAGEMVILSASPEACFLGWYENGGLLSTEPEYVFVCEGPRTVTAMFLDGTQEHVHAYTETVTAPTCTEKGYTTYTCDCGDSYTGNEVPVLDHRYVAGICQLCGAADVSFVPGDVDGDGVLSYNDALTVLRGSIGLAVLTPQQERIADFDGDGGISYNDALMILRASIGL